MASIAVNTYSEPGMAVTDKFFYQRIALLAFGVLSTLAIATRSPIGRVEIEDPIAVLWVV